jgi:hypothetical protein
MPSMSRCYLQAIIRALQVADGRAAVLQGHSSRTSGPSSTFKLSKLLLGNERPCEFMDAGSSDNGTG